MPVTIRQWEESLRQPALCELLPVRDYLDDCIVRTNGSFVAGYAATGLNTFFHSDETRNRTKEALEALVRSLPERSMRMQVRYEVTEGYGNLPERYLKEQSIENPVLQTLDCERLNMWRTREEEGQYLQRHLHVFFIWNPDVHRESPDFEWRKTRRATGKWNLAANKCIERSLREHQDLLSEFESLMSGVQATLEATGMQPRRMNDQELFLEAKRALNPLIDDVRPHKQGLAYESARSQMANVGIEDEQDDYLKIGGLLYSWLSLKEMPDATFPGITRELAGQEFPLVISAEVSIPDQNKIMRSFKHRLLRMQAAQRDIHGGFKINVEAQIAQEQLIQTLQDVVSSSLKICQLSLVVGVRTSKPIRNSPDREEAERILADRRQRVLHAITRMSGARAIAETLAQKRIFVGTLPGMAEETKREQECLTLHAADLMPVEAPWQGLSSPVILFDTPTRQMVAFSPFDSTLGDANMLIMAKTGGGKTFMAQLLLLMLARTNVQVSILERGDSYRPLVELMGGRIIDVNLDGNETLNPWDLPPGETAPSREKIAFLKNLTRHMIGDAPGSDSTLIDNVISEAIARTYKRVGLRYANPIPTFSDLRDELAQWQDEEKMQRATDEAKLVAVKLRNWTEKGIYSKLFDRHTNIRIDDNWLFFNVEGLSSDAHLETAMSMLIANAMSERASGRSGQCSVTILDECWSLLDSPVLAPEVVQLFRTARKRNSSVWGISQTLEDFVGTSSEPRLHGPGIVKNSHTKLIGQQPGDLSALEKHLHLNEVALSVIKRFNAPQKGRYAEMLLVIGEKSETSQTVRLVPTPIDYWICTTYPRERAYRAWYLSQNPEAPLLDYYQEIARKFPQGLAGLPQLPEELSGAVRSKETLRAREGRC
jgi:type IV secretory pathway VirB4 component